MLRFLKYLNNKIKDIPFFYDRAFFISKIIKSKGLKRIYLLLLIHAISKLFKNREDFFEIRLLLDGIYDQYKLNKEKLNINLLPFVEGMFIIHSTKNIKENRNLQKELLKINHSKRSYQYQTYINILEYKIHGSSKKWFDFKDQLINTAISNYPLFEEDKLFLGPDWYLSIGHTSLLGYLGIAYPDKFTLLIVQGIKICNPTLLNTFKSKFKVRECSPLFFNALSISQPRLIYAVDDTRFSENKDPVSSFVLKGIKQIEKSPYKSSEKFSKLNQFLNKTQINGHTIHSEYVTLHVKGLLYEKRNSIHTPARNSDINTYIKAIQYLLNQNINVVRIGDFNSPKLPYMDGFIDLTMAERDVNKDIPLLANAKFHIGTPSGPVNVPPLFGIPVLLTNSVRPLIQTKYPMSLGISKRCLHIKSNKFLPYGELLKSDFVKEEMKRVFGEYQLIDNSSDEILDAVKDMFKLTGHKQYDKQEKEYKKVCDSYEKYLKSNSLDNLFPHMPLSLSFLKEISKS